MGPSGRPAGGIYKPCRGSASWARGQTHRERIHSKGLTRFHLRRRRRRRRRRKMGRIVVRAITLFNPDDMEAFCLIKVRGLRYGVVGGGGGGGARVREQSDTH